VKTSITGTKKTEISSMMETEWKIILLLYIFLCHSSINTDFTTKWCALGMPNHRIFRCTVKKKLAITTDIWIRNVTFNA